MPSNTSRSTLSRQWELLKLLPSRTPGATAAELQSYLSDAGYVTSKRTVERDLVDLSQLFPLQCNDKGTPYGWYWAPGCSIDLPGIALSEAMTLRLVEDSIRPLIPSFMLKSLEPRFDQARNKLAALSDANPSAKWLDKVASTRPEFELLAPEINPQVLENVQHALLHDLQLGCHYHSADKNQSREHILNPLGLVQRGQITYLVATSAPYADIRLFTLHRFAQAEPLLSPCESPDGFSLATYIATGAFQFGVPQKIQLHAWVNSELARRLLETPLSANMQLAADGEGALLTATVTDSWELKWWLLSNAGLIEIRQPQTLREEILASLRNALQLHSE